MVFWKNLISEVLISYSVERVWEVIAEFEDFSEWNPLILRASGEIKAGTRLRLFNCDCE